MKISNLTKEEIKNCLEKDPDDFAEQLYKMIWAFCYKEKEGEDVVQELMLHILRNIEKFDHTRSNFTTFVYMHCNSKYLNLIRNNKTQKRGGGIKNKSLHDKIAGSDEKEYIDIIETSELTGLEKIEDDYKKTITKYVYENLLHDYTREYLEGVTQQQLAIKYNVSQACISQWIKKDIENAKKEVLRVGEGKQN